MKKLLAILALLLALCMLCGVAMADTDSEDGGESYFDPTRIHEVDGHEVNTDSAREMRKATCTQKGLWRYDCEDDPTHFHEVYSPALGHDWDDGKVTKEPTCTEAGVLTKTCKRCGVTKTEPIKALGHLWSSDEDGTQWGKVVKEPTCTEKGEALDYCKRCDVIRELHDPRIIDEVPHFFIAVIDQYPTCKDEGWGHFECVWCEFIPEQADVDNGTYDLSNGDDGELTITLPTGMSVTVGYDSVYFTLPVDPDGHDWDNWVLIDEATCYQPMSYVRWCKICGDKQEEVLDDYDKLWAFGYDIEDFMDDGRLAPVYVSTSRLVDCFTEEVTLTCKNCYKLNDDGTEEFAPGHDPVVFQRDVTSHIYDHSDKLYKSEAAAKKAEPTFAEYKAATCEEDGYIAYKCIYDDSLAAIPTGENAINATPHDEDTYDYVVIPALGHDWSAWEERYAPGAGDNEYGYWLRECERCHKTEEKIAKQQPAEMCGDNHDFLETEIVDATCTEAGSITYTCSKCGTEKTEEIPALGHNYEVEVVAEPTCSKAGKQLLTCANCGDEYTEVLPKLAHTPEVVPAVPVTCTEDGLTEGSVCAVCGEVLVEQEVIKAVGAHDYKKVEAVAPTCTAAGNTEGVVCSVCGDVLVEAKEVPALGHTPKAVEGKAATCTVAGLTEGSVCSVCGEVLVAQEEIPALGHDWDEGEITKEATPEADGEKTFTCKACGETKTEPVAFEFNENPAYELKDMAYGNNMITGTVAHDPTTVEASKLYARVTVFFVGGTYAVFADYIEDDVISIEVHGTVLAVSVELTATKNVVPGDDLVVFDSWGEYYKD